MRIDPPGGSDADAESPRATPPRALCGRLRTHLPEKVALLLGLSVGICVPYFSLQRLEALPVRTLPTTALDRWVGFEPSWLWAYASIAVLVPLFPLLATRREELVRYARGLAILCAACFALFLLLPVAGPRPELVAGHGGYRVLVAYDGPLNSLPSLHAGLTLYSFLFGYRVLRGSMGRGRRGVYALVACAWTGVILYSTLATKQHWALDLPPGLLLAWLSDRFAWRRV